MVTSERGHYTRNLVSPTGNIERLEVRRDRKDEFVAELSERYKRMTGDVEEAALQMYLSVISVRKTALNVWCELSARSLRGRCP